MIICICANVNEKKINDFCIKKSLEYGKINNLYDLLLKDIKKELNVGKDCKLCMPEVIKIVKSYCNN